MVRHVIGPQSALTDFLAANDISANRIRQDAEQRRAAVAAQNQDAQGAGDQGNAAEGSTSGADTGGEDAPENATEDATADPGPSTQTRGSRARHNETTEEEARRKQTEKKAIEKIKASKAFKKRARHVDDEDDIEEMARALFEERSAPLPGQMDNCEICEKRFTVTPYSRSGPNGGLLCAQCSRESDKEKPPPKKVRKSTGGVGRRRNIQSRIMDGTYHLGAKNLIRLCIETLARNVHLAEDLGELPPHVVDKIARLFSKRRLLNPKTLPLFVHAATETLNIYSAAYLSTDDLIGIFQTCSRLRELRIRDGIHFKDEVMDYVLGRHIKLEKLSLHGANLLGSDRWKQFLAEKGTHLKTLQSYCTDLHFGDDVVAAIAPSCPNLVRLKIDGNQELTSDGTKKIADITSLQHLNLRLLQKITAKSLVHVIRGVGANLETLSIKGATEANDEVLMAIKTHCTSLQKLRVTLGDRVTDEGFVDLFTEWRNGPLRFVDFEGCRQLDAANPRENPEKIGLCSDGFRALMAHSVRDLRHLNVASCRHIAKQAFEDVFAEDKVYKDLRVVDVSFCEEVDDFVVGCILRCCPVLQHLKVFGCMKVTSEVKLPPNVILIGVPNAMGVEIVGR